MSSVFKTGAFVQQCFFSHPLCLGLKKLARPDQLVLACTACNMRHGLTLRNLTTLASEEARASREPRSERGLGAFLVACAANHPLALRVRSMDVLSDSVGLRCVECRRVFDLDVAAFETHQE